jgi:hypothetical protein
MILVSGILTYMSNFTTSTVDTGSLNTQRVPHLIQVDGKEIFKFRLGINYRSILKNHIFTNSEQKYMMLLPFERGMFAVS